MSENARILVIDDEKNYLLVLEALLADAGYSVTAINDPEMALAFLDDSEVDVVITDMKMPKMTGKEVLQSIKKSSILLIPRIIWPVQRKNTGNLL